MVYRTRCRPFLLHIFFYVLYRIVIQVPLFHSMRYCHTGTEYFGDVARELERRERNDWLMIGLPGPDEFVIYPCSAELISTAYQP
jgi:hypothetical protein